MTVIGYDVYDIAGDPKKYLCRYWDEKNQDFKETAVIEEALDGAD